MANPRLLLVAHGTASPAGTATTANLMLAVAAARADVPVDLCFLDVATPTLPDALAGADAAVVVVPLLLSTGYHVEHDIPAAVAGRPGIVVARHLGPDPLLTDALADRLAAAHGADGASRRVVLAATGSSRPAAGPELDAAAALLSARLGAAVTVLTLDGDVAAALRTLSAPLRVATYLLAEGRFEDRLRAAAGPDVAVAAPLGTHPAVVELVWERYDAALR